MIPGEADWQAMAQWLRDRFGARSDELLAEFVERLHGDRESLMAIVDSAREYVSCDIHSAEYWGAEARSLYERCCRAREFIAKESASAERRSLLRQALLALDAVARTGLVLCFCGDGCKTCDCGGDAVRAVLRDAASAGFDPLAIEVRVPEAT